jgi:tight adherence protein B
VDPSVALAILLLAGVSVGFISLIAASRRRKALSNRLSATVATGQAIKPVDTPTIRVRPRDEARFQGIARLLRVPVDVPRAHVMSPVTVFLIGIVAGLGAFYLSGRLLPELAAALVGALAAVLAVRGLFSWEMTQYRAKLVRHVPDVVQLVVSATRAGLPVSEAFRAIAKEMQSPTKEEFLRVENALALGESPEQALLAVYRRTGVAEYAIFAVTIGVQARSGGRLAETMQNLAETVRERLAIIGRAKAMASEAKTSGFIMGALPVIAGVFMSFTQPEKMALFFNDPRGTRLFAIGAGTMLAGILTMRQMIAGVSKD